MSLTVDTPPAGPDSETVAADPVADGEDGSSGGKVRRWVSPASSWVLHLVVAGVAFIPQLLAQPGVVDSDTKSYLYLDTGRFLQQSISMWDPTNGLGTVTHEQIGYLWPMGPFFWAVHGLGIPLWVGERLWVGAILFLAGTGMLALCRTMGVHGPGRLVAAFAFMLSPYFLQYVGRISVILLPYAALPWLIALAARSVRTRGWRFPALFALVWLSVSAINASSAIYAGLAPALWLPYAVLVTREARWRDAWAAAWRIALLTVLVSLWWVAALAVEGGYGLNILKYTETVQTVAATSLASEVLRGLGYWYFYDGDELGQWVSTSVQFTQQLWLIALSFAVPLVAFLGAVLVRWRARAYFVFLVLIGMVAAVGAHPYVKGTIVAKVIKTFMTRTEAGLALRSTDRATPMVILGLAILLGAGVTAIYRKSRLAGLLVGLLILGLVVAADPPVFNGTTVADHFTQPSPLPHYVTETAQALNAVHKSTRVLAIPGENFAAYRYGDVIDPVWPGVLTRPFVTREQQALGSLASYDLLYGLDNPMQNGIVEPNAIAPLARLMSAGDLLLQNDLAYERYNSPRPLQMASDLSPTPAGLSTPVGYGSPRPNISQIPLTDEEALATSPDQAWPAPEEVFAVADPRPIVRAESTAGELLVDGDGVGLDEAASAGLLNSDSSILYAGTLDTHKKTEAAALASNSTLVLTDSNRKTAFRWNTILGNAGETLTTSQPQPNDPNNAPLNLFPGTPADAQTTVALQGVDAITASSYGNVDDYLPEDRPSQALDGNLNTAWETGAFTVPTGQWWQVRLTDPLSTDHVTLVQPLSGVNNQWITKVTLSFDGKDPVKVALGPASKTAAGQVVSFPSRSFQTLRIRIDRTNLVGASPTVIQNASPVGLAQVEVGGAQEQEIVDMPSDLLSAAGSSSIFHRLAIVMTRERVAPIPPRSDLEPTLSREFSLPTARSFTLTGSATVNTLIPDATIDTLVGRPGATGSGVVAYSLGRLPGDLHDTASAAVDGNSSTMWSPGFGPQVGEWIQVHVPRPITFSHLNLQIVADGHHSVPTSLTVSTENGSDKVTLPPISDGRRQDATVTVPISFPPLSGEQIQVTFTGVRAETTKNYYSHDQITLPLGIAELGLPGVDSPAPPAQMPGNCQSNLLTIDGRPVSVSVTGSTADALNGKTLTVQGCGPDAHGITLGPGEHVIQSASGHVTGFDIDQLVLDSAAGGGAEPETAGGPLPAPQPGPAPTVAIKSQTATGFQLKVSGVTSSAFWLTLGESVNKGWQAVVDSGGSGPGKKLGPSTLIDGFGNGWLVDPATLGGALHNGTLEVTLSWLPQKHIDEALIISAGSALLCLLLALLPNRWRTRIFFRRRRRRAAGAHALGSSSAAGAAGPDGSLVLSGVNGPVGRWKRDRPNSLGVVRADVRDDPPELGSPLSAGGRRPVWWAFVVSPVLAGGIAAGVLTRPKIGLAIGGAVLLVLIIRHLRFLLSLTAIGMVAATGAYTVKHQSIFHFPPGGWPINFEPASLLAWLAVVALAADAIVDVARGATRVPVPPPPVTPAESAPSVVSVEAPETGTAVATATAVDTGTAVEADSTDGDDHAEAPILTEPEPKLVPTSDESTSPGSDDLTTVPESDDVTNAPESDDLATVAGSADVRVVPESESEPTGESNVVIETADGETNPVAVVEESTIDGPTVAESTTIPTDDLAESAEEAGPGAQEAEPDSDHPGRDPEPTPPDRDEGA